MTNPADSRLDGIYKQRQEGFYMQRVKLPVGVITAEQVLLLCRMAERFGRGIFHLTTRGNIEIHWIEATDLPSVKRVMASVGLTARGACGGAVRGVTCSSHDNAKFPQIEFLARRLHRHFTGNPRFERLPKKFKIGIEPDSESRRHLIQDVGLVQVKNESGKASYDVWVAGGLGREPQPGFLLLSEVSEDQLIPIIEIILKIYAARTPAGKRLKHLIREIGEDAFRELVQAEPGFHEELPPFSGITENIFEENSGMRVEVPVFAGELTSKAFRKLAKFAQKWANGALMVTAEQNIAFEISKEDQEAAFQELKAIGFFGSSVEERVKFRVCPGSHECLMGLAATRDTARRILKIMGPDAAKKSWAISGCPNSCTQPQLSEVGIVVSRLVSDDDGRNPRFDLYKQQEQGFGKKIKEALTQKELFDIVQQMG